MEASVCSTEETILPRTVVLLGFDCKLRANPPGGVFDPDIDQQLGEKMRKLLRIAILRVKDLGW
jgi:hypothetical protein